MPGGTFFRWNEQQWTLVDTELSLPQRFVSMAVHERPCLFT
jgi:hypothetical protein